MSETPQVTRCFGIRHHGPGCARSLEAALEAFQPDCVLVEGPPEGAEAMGWLNDPALAPPVALLVHAPEHPCHAAFYPFADFSPEWTALRHAALRRVDLRFIDLPLAHRFALEQEGETAPAPTPVTDEAGPETDAEDAPENAEPDPAADPLDALARAAGFEDGETWWNHLVEERGPGADIFAAIAEMMTEARREAAPRGRGERGRRIEGLREAHMRKCMREAEASPVRRIAVVCGAWHVPALVDRPKVKDDQALLRGLPRLKVEATWVPWTHGRLTLASGYGAGVAAPGWYEHVWRHGASEGRAVAWLTRVARLLRGEEMEVSSAHVIEAVRLSGALASLRGRPTPGLEEFTEAVRAIFGPGDDAVLALVRQKLLVGDRLGTVPDTVPAVPVQQDVARLQKSLRLKPEALERVLDLDLRQELDLARSHFIRRLGLIGVAWGEESQAGGARGSFHEMWKLQWKPEFALDLIQAARLGTTVEQAAVGATLRDAEANPALPALADLLTRCLLAGLAGAVEPVTRRLEDAAAVSADTAQLLEALPALAGTFRYGSVRRTDTELVARVLDGLIRRACIGLSGLCAAPDDEAAEALHAPLVAAGQAVRLRGDEELLGEWHAALRRLTPLGSAHARLSGLAARLLLDAGQADADEAAAWMSRALSVGHDPAPAAAWLEGFLGGSGAVLLHDDRLFTLLDEWIGALTEDHFLRVLPLVRRAFSGFTTPERAQLGARSRRGVAATGASAAPIALDETRASRALPLLNLLLGNP